jgi:hypothetical protein
MDSLARCQAFPGGLMPRTTTPRRALLRLAGPVLVAGLLSSCQRRAPGPDECEAFAKAWLRSRGVTAPEQMLGRGPIDSNQADPFTELVTRCLTEPYDRTLVSCVVNGKNPALCRSEFARRREASRGD